MQDLGDVKVKSNSVFREANAAGMEFRLFVTMVSLVGAFSAVQALGGFAFLKEKIEGQHARIAEGAYATAES